jgi:hypothetical protein
MASYNIIAGMVSDPLLNRRLTACAALEGVPDPATWVNANVWGLVANDEMANAYESAIANGVDQPGRAENVITDQMILTHVQALRVG